MEPVEIKVYELMIGNYVSIFDHTEMVEGIIPDGGSQWIIQATSIGERPDFGVSFKIYGIPLDDAWKRVLGVYGFNYPHWIQFVHQLQNWYYFKFGKSLIELKDKYDVPLVQDFD